MQRDMQQTKGSDSILRAAWFVDKSEDPALPSVWIACTDRALPVPAR